MVLQRRCREILVSLALRVRVFSLPQVAGHWWTSTSTGLRAARRRLRILEDADLVEQQLRIVRPDLELEVPLFVATAEADPTDFSKVSNAIAWQAEKRSRTTARPTTVYIATVKGAAMFGGRGGRINFPAQLNHDLGLSSTYLHFLTHRPDEAFLWSGENEVRRRRLWRRVPDAIIEGEDGRPVTAIEFVSGSYTARRIREDLEWAMRRIYADELATYEVW